MDEKCNRGVQLLESGSAIQEGIQLLSHPNLHPVLHARYRVLGILLARSGCCACSGVTRYIQINDSNETYYHIKIPGKNFHCLFILLIIK